MRQNIVNIILLVIALVTFGLSSGEYLFVAMMTILVLASLFIRKRLAIPEKLRKIIILILLIIFALKSVIFIESVKGFIPYLFSLAQFLSALSLLFIYKKEEPGDTTTLFCLAGGIMICAGNAEKVPLYPASLSIFFLLSTFLFLSTTPICLKKLPTGLAIAITLALVLCVGFSLSLIYFFKWLEPQRTLLLRGITKSQLDFSGLSNVTSLGYEGEFFESNRVVLRIFSPVKPQILRGRVYITYSHGKWLGKTFPCPQINQAARLENHMISPYILPGSQKFLYGLCCREELSQLLKSKGILQTVVLEAQGGRNLYITEQAFLLQTDCSFLFVDRAGVIIHNHPGHPVEYSILAGSKRYPDIVDRLVVPSYYGGPEVTDEEVLASCLQIPYYFSTEFRALALYITRNCHSDYEMALAVKDYFHSNFIYKLGYTPPKEADPVEEFVLKGNAAHCEYFASGMALLLREVNVPARYVVGFLVKEYSPGGGYYIVREKDVHAWCEAYLKDRGWVTFDPTPPCNIDYSRDRTMGWISDVADRMMLLTTRVIAHFNGGGIFNALKLLISTLISLMQWLSSDWLRFAAFCTVMIAAITAFLFLEGKKVPIPLFGKARRSKSAYGEVAQGKKLRKILAGFDKILKKMGLLRPAHYTLKECIDALTRKYEPVAHIKTASRIISKYYELRYSGEIPGEEDLDAIREELEALGRKVKRKR